MVTGEDSWTPYLSGWFPPSTQSLDLGLKRKMLEKLSWCLSALLCRDSTATFNIQMTSMGQEHKEADNILPRPLAGQSCGIYEVLCYTFSIISSEGSQSAWEGRSVRFALHPPTSLEFMLSTSMFPWHFPTAFRIRVLHWYNSPHLKDMETGHM